MALSTLYYAGGFLANAPAQNKQQEADSVAGTFTTWDTHGVQTAQRPLTTLEAAQFAALATSITASANQVTIQAQAQAALSANAADLAQDATIITQAATVTGTSGALTLAQLSTIVRQLAQAVAVLAQNDMNTKKELNALIRLALGQFDSTS